MSDFINTIDDLVGKSGHVMYSPITEDGQDTDTAYQVDGIIMGTTPEAIEGQSVILFEDEYDDEPEGLRSIPLDWVVAVTEAR